MNDRPPKEKRARSPAGARPMWSLMLRKYRQDAKLTQKELAERLGASQTTVASWETGQNEPSIEVFEKIADALGVRLVDIVQTSLDVTIVREFVRSPSFKKLSPDSVADRGAVLVIQAQLGLGMALLDLIENDEFLLKLMGDSEPVDLVRTGIWKRLYTTASGIFLRLGSDMDADLAVQKAAEEAVARLRAVATGVPLEIKRD